jgi:hypothetical protein
MTQATSNVEKTPPQPQQQPNKPQKTTLHKKQTHHKHPKKLKFTKKPTTTTQEKQRTQNQLATYSLLHFLQTQQVFLLSDNKHFQTATNLVYKKYWLYSLCCFVLPLPNLSLAVKIFSVANSREAMYIMTTVKMAT